MRIIKSSRLLIIGLFCLSTRIGAFAQSLPNKQLVSVRAPTNVKIDGKGTEWGDKMRAYNKTTQIFYTIANDDKKLYLVVQCSDDKYMNKVVHGITLIVQPTGEKNTDGASTVKFPILDNPGEFLYFILHPSNPEGVDGPLRDPDGKKAEAVIQQSNKLLKPLSKKIYTKGVFGKDSILSIYNEAGIAAANGFDKGGIYTSELAIDLTFLGLKAGRTEKFSYQISVNAEPNRSIYTSGDVRARYRPSPNQTKAEIDELMEKRQADANVAVAAENIIPDFWGEYTLAK